MKFATSVIFSLFIVGIYAATTPLSESGLPAVPASSPSDLPEVKPKPKPTTTTTAPTTESTPEPKTTDTPAPTPAPTQAPTPAPAPAPEPKTTTATTTTTTSAPVPTTPRPVPGKPEIGKYILTDGNQTCILAEFAAQLNFSYISADTNKTEYFVYNLPGSGNDTKSAKGSCGNGTTDQYIVIEWTEDGHVNTLNLTFHLNATTNEFSLTESVFNLSSIVIPGVDKSFVFYRVGSFFEIPKDRSYYCTRVQSLNVTDSETAKNTVGTVSVSHVLLEAYHSAQNKQYSSSIDCDAINTPDIVPIAVGICLIALVVIVLIAYLVGRRRAAARGYVSM